MHVQGLITDERENIDLDALPFARKVKEIHRQGLKEGASLVEVVREFFTFHSNINHSRLFYYLSSQ